LSILEAVGNTPLIHLKKLSRKLGHEIYGKAEFMNPGGSVKDRAAKSILRAALKSGQLSPGGTIVEGTAGNTGIGLATLAPSLGVQCVIVMPDNQSEEKYQILRALGAKLVVVKPVPFADQNHFYHTARRLAEETPGAFWANQFENTANADIHFQTTGPEMWHQTNGQITDFVAATGTGGTLGGVSAFLKLQNPKIQITLADPNGSGMHNYIQNKEIKSQGSSVTEGIGIMRLTENFKRAQIDASLNISDEEMISMLYFLAHEEGLLVGTSAALNVFAAAKIALSHSPSTKRKIVTILCDSALRYQSKVLNPTWLAQKNLQPKPLEHYFK
jgi:cysteine synthase A